MVPAKFCTFGFYSNSLKYERKNLAKPHTQLRKAMTKMLGCPIPCGIALTRKEHLKKVGQRIAYLNSVGTTVMRSRNGQAVLTFGTRLGQEEAHCQE